MSRSGQMERAPDQSEQSILPVWPRRAGGHVTAGRVWVGVPLDWLSLSPVWLRVSAGAFGFRFKSPRWLRLINQHLSLFNKYLSDPRLELVTDGCLDLDEGSRTTLFLPPSPVTKPEEGSAKCQKSAGGSPLSLLRSLIIRRSSGKSFFIL